MIFLGLAAPRLRKRFAAVVAKLQAELERLRAAESERRRVDRERETAAREAAAEAFRAERERERARRESESESETPRPRRVVAASKGRPEVVTADAGKTAEQIIREAWQADLAAGEPIVAARYDRLAGTNNYARGLIRKWTADEAAEPAEAVA
jgi:hypothetical protein